MASLAVICLTILLACSPLRPVTSSFYPTRIGLGNRSLGSALALRGVIVIRKYPSPINGHVRVVFELPPGIWADRAFVAGDFDVQSEAGIPMTLTRDGIWQAMLDLPAGTRHEFRYRVDGEWRTDYHADGYTSDVHGRVNSVVFAELPAAPSRGEVESTAFRERMAASETRSRLIQKWRARRGALENAA